MAAENNMTVAMCSTPANYFHLLRRQASLAGAPSADRVHAQVAAAAQGGGESARGLHRDRVRSPSSATRAVDPSGVRRVVLCSGKVYYDLLAARGDRRDVALVRVEQLYPLPARRSAPRSAAIPMPSWCWAQEEPANQGAWGFMAMNLPEHLGGRPLLRVSRTASASPAVGSASVHQAQQQELVAAALG